MTPRKIGSPPFIFHNFSNIDFDVKLDETRDYLMSVGNRTAAYSSIIKNGSWNFRADEDEILVLFENTYNYILLYNDNEIEPFRISIKTW